MSARNRQVMPAVRERLLTTREAATFLKVSEASIRRWTDSGLLPARRVGRRRARRLLEDDLRMFMEAGPGPGPAAADTNLSSTMVIQDVVVSMGDHLAAFYTSDAGRLRIGLPFLRDGLRAGHTVVLRALPDIREHYFAALRNEGVDAEQAIQAGQLMIYPEVSGSASDQVAQFEQLLTAASRQRPGPIRILAETLADVETLRSVAEHMVVEQQVGAVFKRFPVVTICAYDVRAFDAVTVIEALKLHSDTFGPQVGYWLN
ncbi:MAG TPA: MEDS domain-containing protein [Candidatus Acidoferrum sp.]|nr:MEDS domain-containing protein [Candidatus Acidoferrum sp.]